jgi:hypothetical protein
MNAKASNVALHGDFYAVPGKPGGDVGTGLGAVSFDGCLGVYDQDHDFIRRDQEG